VMGREVAGAPLAAVSDPIPTGRSAAQGARLSFEDADRPDDPGSPLADCLELVVVSDDGVDVFKGVLAGLDGAVHCPKPRPLPAQ
jgi:hypothetical protein